MRKKYKLKNKKRFVLFISSMILVHLTVVFSVKAYGYKEEEYKEITVHQGDSLWCIAEKYYSSGDIREYIYRIMKINHLSNSNIYAGSKLYIPVDY